MAQLGARFHGMEEVVGSIPTRSTNNPHEFSIIVQALRQHISLPTQVPTQAGYSCALVWLYDLVSDPGEETNLYGNPNHAATQQALWNRVLELEAEIAERPAL